MSGVLAAAAAARNRAQVTFGAAGAGATDGGSGTILVGFPSGITGGDILILHVSAKDATAVSVVTPSGWTAIMDASVTTVHVYAFYKIATGAESGSETITYTGSVYAQGRMYRFSRAVGVEAASATLTAAGATTISNKDVTTTRALAVAVQLMSFDGTGTTLADSTGESGADYTQPTAVYTSTSGGLGIQVATVATATAITGGSATLGATKGNRGAIGFGIYP